MARGDSSVPGGVGTLTGASALKISLFEKLGGFAQVRLIVSDFYDRLLDSEKLRPYFEEIDVRRLIDHQTKFVSALMGGPVSFSNEHLGRAHHHLGISPEEYAEMGEIFRETLEDHDLPDADVERLYAHILSLQEHVIGVAPSEAP
ncbi:MAG: group 1 truncated hemoglobin [Gemmatimonadota bacterium]|jgi:hemoglobin